MCFLYCKRHPPTFLHFFKFLIDHVQSIRAVLAHAGKRLKEISDSPMLDAELILAHCLEKNRSFLHTWPENQLDKKQLECFESHIRKRLRDYPVAYILAYKAFWTFELIGDR